MTLLADVRRDLLDGKPLADLLRKCLLLGSELGSVDLRTWASKELKGYDNLEELPPYRKVSSSIHIDAVTGPGWITGQILPVSHLPEFARDRISNQVPLFSGVGELESLYESARTAGKNPQLSLPSWELIARAIDEASGNPFQHILAMYWTLSPSAIAGVLDHIRTALTEIIAELSELVPDGQAAPTAEQASHALSVAVSGGSPQFHIAAPVTSLHASGSSSIQGITGGQAGVADGDVMQNAAYNASQKDAVELFLSKYRDGLLEQAPAPGRWHWQKLSQIGPYTESRHSVPLPRFGQRPVNRLEEVDPVLTALLNETRSLDARC